ncbi:MAG: protein-export membrane protein SecF [Deltaproteobacteria bacterium RBG_19FT_COMBO_43_11]|nr:MAG: protein-export membrane protein SecF [Deltaproteobacteria bacterium RBG_19FT_COMBO_43_11]
MELIKPGINLDFVGKIKYAAIFSAVLFILSIGTIIFHGGLNLGIDFAGGSIIQVKFTKTVTADQIRAALKSTNLESSIIQQFGANEFLIRTAESFSDQKLLNENLKTPLTTAFNKDYEIRRVEVVGSKVGMDFQRKAIFAVVLSWLAMLIYIAWRFEFRYGLGAVIALVHDVIITIGVVAILRMEFTISILAALFFIIGFSINDTIVVLDRIRENVKLNPKQKLGNIINLSINQTLSRTILTSLTVFLTVLALYFFGGPVIHDFAFALLVGVVIGTYSSIYIACTIVLLFENLQLAKTKRKK